MEFCIQAWSPHFVKDIDVLERVQKAATNLVPMLRKYSYATRLQMIGITSLEERGDMIEVYKLLTGKEQIDHRQFFNSADTPYGLRGHEKKLAKDRSRLDSRKFFFSQSGQWMEQSSGKSRQLGISQQLQERLRPLLLQRYGQQKLISCLSINLQVQVSK